MGGERKGCEHLQGASADVKGEPPSPEPHCGRILRSCIMPSNQIKTNSKPKELVLSWKGKTTPSVNRASLAATDDLMVLF